MIDMAANFGTTVTKKYKKIALARAIWQRSNANDSHSGFVAELFDQSRLHR